MNNNDIFDSLIVIGPDIRAGGGMAEVLLFHRDHIIGHDNFTYLQSNSGKGTLAGMFRLLPLLCRLPVERIKGKKLIHLHVTVGKSFYRKFIIATWGRALGYRFLVHWHGGKGVDFVKSPVNKFFMRRMASMSTGIIALSDYWRDFFRGVFPAGKVFVVNNAISISRGEKRHNAVPTFLYMALLNKSKGVYELLEALSKVRAERQDWKFIIAGKGETEEVRRMIDLHGLQNNVELAGWVSGERKEALLNSADVFVLPTHADAFPMSVLEAMEFGMPVISTTVGSIPEMVAEGENGYLSAPGDVESLARNILRYVGNPELVEAHGAESRRLVKKYSPENVKRQLLDVYKSVFEGNKR